MENTSLVISIIAIVLAIIICILQIRPILTINVRTEIKYIPFGSDKIELFLYADVSNEGMMKSKFKIKSQYEIINSKTPISIPLYNNNSTHVHVPNCVYIDRSNSGGTIPKNDNFPFGKMIPSYEKIHILNRKQKDYFVKGELSFPAILSKDDYQNILGLVGETYISVFPVGFWGLPIIRKANTIKQRIDFNNLFVESVSKTRIRICY